MNNLTDDVIPEDAWVSLANILAQSRSKDKPKVTVALLKEVIEAEGVRTHDQWGKLMSATDGDEPKRTSKARAYKLLAAYYAELMACNDLPPIVHPDQDPDRWLEYFSPLNEFGWPEEEVPKTLLIFMKNENSSNLEMGINQTVSELSNQNGAKSIIEEKPDNDKILSELFDPVPVASLEKMFPADGEWKSWAERASRNGLKAAREGRAKFNPYKAALWFINKGITGWDLARCFRVLANNLPARSRDEAHLLTTISE
ncbi:MAG: hypothetical protein EBU46_07870 [Nitrosomonadaceae bacterium]|nr:hypothetical protein [Nitrosomonadaceae bacterium]